MTHYTSREYADAELDHAERMEKKAMTDLKKLRELCLAATPFFEIGALKSKADMVFIDTFQPQTILKLLDEVEASRVLFDSMTPSVHFIPENGAHKYHGEWDIKAEFDLRKIRKQNESVE